MIQKALLRFATLGALLGLPLVLNAGVNTWTGGRPVETVAGARSLVAAHPDDPDVVYAAFGAELYRSGDGGRTWNHLHAFDEILSLLVHPASPSTIYVGAFPEGAFWSDDHYVFKSTDAGETWAPTLHANVTALAGSPTDASTVFAGWGDRIFKTTDGGASWSQTAFQGAIASLVIDPREPSTAYVGAAAVGVPDSDYYSFSPGGFGQSTDGGGSWLDRTPELLGSDGVFAIALDPVASSTVYIATGHNEFRSGGALGVLRSDDVGASWTSASEGLPDVSVLSLAVDPRVSGTLYAGTEAGIYRTRDGGRSWAPFSQQLAGVPITSLAIADEGRRLHAGTPDGAYDREIARGPLDVSAGPPGESRVLVWDGDRLAVGKLDASGNWTSTPPGDVSATWTAVAIATAGGDRTHVLWQNGDGRTALEIVGASGRESATVFEKRSGWIATDLSVRPDGTANVLWSGADGRMSISRVDPSGATTGGPIYGPAPGWSAVAIADSPGGDTWVLWRSTDGRSALSVHRGGAMVTSYKYAAHPDGPVEDVAVATDGRPRILRTSPAGLASVATVDADGRLTAGQRHELAGFTPRRIAAGGDGITRLLFGSDNGQGVLLMLAPDNRESARHPLR